MLAFVILAVMVVAMALATCIPGGEWIYSSPLFVAGWGGLALVSLWIMMKRKLFRRPALFLFHMAFLVILAGALITHIAGTSQTMHLRIGQTDFAGKLPVTLVDFTVEYYPGTMAPSDYVSTLEIDGRPAVEVAMNKVASVKGYRFYQTGYDSDERGTILTVTHDPIGIAVTYSGYLLLLIGMLAMLLPKRRNAMVAAAMLYAFGANASPASIPESVAAKFGELMVEHNGRVVPVSTLSREFTMKITGSARYRGLTPEQVLSGWLFFYDDWKSEPCIKIKDKKTRVTLGVEGKMASVTDFFDPVSGFKLRDADYSEGNEKFSLVSTAASGSLWRIFPYQLSDRGGTMWYSPVDELPDSLDVAEWTFIRHSLSYLAELAADGQWDEMELAINKISSYQKRHAGVDAMPGRWQMAGEWWLSVAGGQMAVCGVMVVCGLILFLFPRKRLSRILCAIGLLWVLGLIVSAWLATGRVPMANGPETMLWLSFSILALGLVESKRMPGLLPPAIMVGGFALMVASMGLRNPQLTPLMPVLRSPLLSIHVLCVMLAYAGLALTAMCSLGWLLGRKELLIQARRMLIPSVCLMAAGIFIGAVWANVSWGRYWGWDPKEVWALITMLVYCVPLHRGILPSFQRDRVFALYCSVAFLTVLMTYFGVNFVLGGLHSYA